MPWELPALIRNARFGGGAAFIAAAAGAFPGQVGNPVGFAAAHGFSSLTTYPGGIGGKTIDSSGTNSTSGVGTSDNPWVYQFYDFNLGASNLAVTGSHIKFIGCRMQSNNVNASNITTTGADITFSYCSFVPLVSLWASPPNGAWPSAGAGLGIVPASAGYTNTGGYCVPSSDGYQFGVLVSSGGPVTLDHCDVWGFANAVTFMSTSTQMTVNSCWIHDAANCNVTPPGAGTNYHTDGPGYENGGVGTTNVTITGNTIASIGNTNGIAFQLTTAPYNNIIITGNFLSGFGDLVSLGTLTTGSDKMTNSVFQNNVFGTDVAWIFNIVHNDYSSMFHAASGNGNTYGGNKLSFLPGTSPNAGSSPSFTSADNGKFVLPDGTLSTTDFVP